MDKIYVIIDDNGKIWRESARHTHDKCRNDFVREWLSRIANHISNHECWNVWNAFNRAGWRIEEIEISPK